MPPQAVAQKVVSTQYSLSPQTENKPIIINTTYFNPQSYDKKINILVWFSFFYV